MPLNVTYLTEGNDTYTVTSDYLGVVYGLGGHDNITVYGRESRTINIILRDDRTDWDPVPRPNRDRSVTDVNAGQGADTLTLIGYGLDINVGDDMRGDMVNARQLMQGIIHVERSDTVYSANHVDAQVVVLGDLTNGFNFIGGVADDYVSVGSDVKLYGWGGDDTLSAHHGSILYGGLGNDQLTALEFAKLYGGDGNDTMYGGHGVAAGGNGDDFIVMGQNSEVDGGAGNDTISAFDYNSVIRAGDGDDIIFAAPPGRPDDDRFSDFYNGLPVRVQAGAGNDTVFMDGTDRVWLGAGSDSVTAHQRAGYEGQTIGFEGSIFDFNKAEDTLDLVFTDQQAELDLSDLTIREANGNTVFVLDGWLTFQMFNVTGLTIRVLRDDLGEGVYTDLAGNRVTGTDFDVTIDVFEDILISA